MKRRGWIFAVLSALGLSGLLSLANLFLGDLNQDEGWYLYAARQVAEGRVLYRDFMFTQGPALPYVYGALFGVVERLGVAGGRLISSLFGLAAAGGAAWLAARATARYRRAAALSAFVLVGVNVYQSYFTTIVKTYGLCAFFLMAGFVFLSHLSCRRGALAAFWGGVFLALAACARLSAGIVLPIVGGWLIWNDRALSSRARLPAWVAFGLGGGAMLLVGLGPFFQMAFENTQFALLGYHVGRSPGGAFSQVALKAGFISRFVRAYGVLAAGTLGGLCALGTRGRFRWADLLAFLRSWAGLLWLCGIGMSAVHWSAPFPYDDYQVIVYPLLCAALAASWVPHLPERYLLRWAWALLLICGAASFSSPLNQNWLVRGRDRIWWNFKESSDLMALRAVGAQVRDRMGADDLLLTQDTYLAVEAGARVPHGMEMGPFCYYPNLSRARAERLHLLNREMMLELLARSSAPLAAFSGYGLAVASPAIEPLSAAHAAALRAALLSNYIPSSTVPHFGQAHTALELFERME